VEGVVWETLVQVALQAISQAPWALALIIIILVVYVRLRDEFRGELRELRKEFRDELKELRIEFRDELEGLRSEFRELRREFRGWVTVVNTNLIGVMALLASEGRIPWDAFLKSVRELMVSPGSESRYYTKADEEELRRLLNKDYREYTEEDARRIEEIARKVIAEAEATGREDLYEAYYWLRSYAQLIRFYLRLGKKTASPR
jgi:methyl-accepting chemotaxis protein